MAARSHFPAPPLAADSLKGVTTARAARESGRARRPRAASRGVPARGEGCSADTAQGRGPRGWNALF